MSIDKEYYKKKICPLCIKYNTEECKELLGQEIQEKDNYQEKVITMICKEYKNNENVEIIQNNVESKMSLRNYYKNYKEV